MNETTSPLSGPRPHFSHTWPSPRWRKVVRDILTQKQRTALAVLSIAVGVFGLTVILATQDIVARDLAATFLATNPSSAIISTLAPFSEESVDVVRRIPGVADAEGRTVLGARLSAGGGEWRNVQLISVPDFEAIRIDRINPDSGAWPPPDRSIVIERSALRLIGAEVGDDVVVKAPGGRERTLRISGLAHDMYALLYTLDGLPWGYVNKDTLEWLGAPPGINEVHLLADEDLRSSQDEAGRLAREARDKIEESGTSVFLMSVPVPGEHPLHGVIQSILLILGSIGLLSLLLGGLLVTNTLSAILAGEVRAIGVMKAIGARSGQLLRLYTAFVLVLGALALAVALPLATLVTGAFARTLGVYLNFNISDDAIPARALTAGAVMSLVVPVVAAFVPIVAGTRVSVREAISSYGLGRGSFGTRRFDRWLRRLGRLPRPFLMSMRNTFRRRVRLALTLTTLTLASATFMAVFSIRASAMATLDEILDLWQYDLMLELGDSYRADRLVEETERVPGVVAAEAWGFETAHWPDEDSSGGSYFGFVMPIIVFGPPAESELLAPTMLNGRWLMSDDENAVVVNTGVLKERPGLEVGDDLSLTIAGRDLELRVVGIVRDIGLAPILYMDGDFLSDRLERSGRASTVVAVTERHSLDHQTAVASILEDVLANSGVRVSLVAKIAQEREEASALLNTVMAVLVAMAALLAVVGALALTGALSLSVLERTREIGVMRAIGASGGQIGRIFIGEALVIALLSWMAGALLAIPLGMVLSRQIGIAMLTMPLSFAYPASGPLAILAAMAILALIASLLPSRRATKITVREALSYE